MGACQANAKNVKSTKSRAKVQLKKIYHVKKDPIGKGAFAKVLMGELKANPEIKVAIKVFQKSKLSELDVKYIKEEVKVLCKLDHPNIVKYYDVFEDHQFIFIVTEHLEGKTLSQEILERESPFSEMEVAKIMLQLISALHHCHSSNIAHRDIKPDNIIIDEDHNITLIDFGLAKAYTRKRDLLTKAGSMYFMAPEIEMKKEYSSKCDIWSCGVLMYIMLANDMPFNTKKYSRIVGQIEPCVLTFEAPVWSKISSTCKKLLSRMITANPEKRIGILELIDHMWLDIARTDSTCVSELYNMEHSLISLRDFREMSLLQHSVFRILVNLVPSNKTSGFKEEFDKIDEDNDGKISFKDLKRAVQASHMDISNEQIQAIIDSLDFFKSGKIHYTDYLVARIHQSEIIDMKLIESVFNQFDSNCDGKVDKYEISKEFENMLRPCSLPEISEMIKCFDSKNRGYLNISDFRVMITNPTINSIN